MKKTISILALSFLTVISLFGQRTITGTVTDAQSGEPIIGAEVVWKGTGIGVLAFVDGSFSLDQSDYDTLVISSMGYISDTIDIRTAALPLDIKLKEEVYQLQNVTVNATGPATQTSHYSPIQTQKITGAELCRAACCNLSESFETNASVDVAYSDAATGAKQIKMLGLSGIYVQLLTENSPGVRGLAQNFGMEYIPGQWMESIQVSKGTASVINGYEATTGQINIEYLKPQTADKIAINGVFNQMVGGEVNLTAATDVNDIWSTGVLAHYKGMFLEHDANGDGFRDLPTMHEVNVMNRWYYKTDKHTAQYLIRGLYDQRQGGTMNEFKGTDREYEIGMKAWRAEALVKQGFIFNKEKGTSIGLIVNGSYHSINNGYGRCRNYSGGQGSLNFNGIFQTNFNDANKLSAGISVNYDDYKEYLADERTDLVKDGRMNMDRWEVTPGIFAEYSYKYGDKLSILLGVRADYSTKYGFFATPRFNFRYSPWSWVALRTSVGLGYRSPNMLTDYAFVLPSSRQIVLTEDLKQERAMNAGVSLSFFIPIAGRELTITGDYYYTHFIEGVVVDMDSDPHKVIFSNLNGGRAYSHNVQVEATMEILKGWTMTLAYRWNDVKTTINGNLVDKPLTGKFKGLITTSYTTPLKHWQFDFTAQFNGGGRMPNPGESVLWKETYNWYPQLMAQITRYFRNASIYIGAENMTNFRQPDPIISAEDPYSQNFDASMPWGPIDGWKLYVGFRWGLMR